MKNSKHNNPASEQINYFKIYSQLNKTNKKDWYDDNTSYNQRDESLQNYLNQISIVKVLQPKNIVIQKRETGNAYSFRIAISRKREERFIGTLPNNTECLILIIKGSRKPFVEIFISESLKGDICTFIKKLENGELDLEMKSLRVKYSATNKAIERTQPE